MANIGYATLQVIPSLRGMERHVNSQLGQVARAVAPKGEQAGGSFIGGFGRRIGSGIARVASDIGQTVTSSLTAAATVAGGLFATALFQGWNRFTTIEDATSALTITLGDATRATELLDEVMQVVTGTPYNFDQFAAAAQQLVGFGVETEKIPTYLTAIGEASATQGRRANEFAERLSTVFGQVAASGQMSLADVWRISDTGVNALAILANHFDLSRDAMKDMISEGAVPAGEALDALAQGILEGSDGPAGATVALAGTMEALRETLTGSAGGFRSALSRFGASIIAPFGEVLTEGFTAAAGVLDTFGAKLGDFAERVVESGPFRSAIEWLMSIPERLSSLNFSGLQNFSSVLIPLGAALAGLASTNLAAALGPLGALIPRFSPLLGLLVGIVAVSGPMQATLGRVVGIVSDLAVELGSALAPILPGIIDALGTIGSYFVQAFADALEVIGPALIGILPSLGESLLSISDSFVEILDAAAPVVPVIAEFAALLIDTLAGPAFTVVAEGVDILAQGVRALGDWFPALIAGLIAAKAAIRAKTIVMAAWNAVMAVNPIYLIVGALAALVAGLVWAYQNVEWFREAVHAVGRFFVRVAGYARDFGQAVWDAGAAVVGWLQDLPGRIAGAFGAVRRFFTRLPGQILSALGSFASTIGDWFVTGLRNLPRAIGFAIGGLVAAFVGIPALILYGLYRAGEFLWTRWLWPALQALPGLISSGIGATIDFFVSLPGRIISAIATAATWLWDEWLWPAISALPGLLATGIVGTLNFFIGLPGQILSALGSLISTLWQAGTDLLTGLYNGIVNYAPTVWGWISSIPGLALSAIGSLLRTLWDKGSDLLSGLLDGAKSGWNAVNSWLGGIPGRVLSAIGSLARTLWQLGRDLIQGLWDGVRSLWNRFTGWFGSRFDDLVLDLARQLGVQSPSRVFMEIGGHVVDGLRIGLDRGWDDIDRWTRDHALELAAAFDLNAPQPLAPAPGVGVGSSPTELVLTVDGMDRDLVRMIAKRVRTDHGGNVHVALGGAR